jgi:hypothetical protein
MGLDEKQGEAFGLLVTLGAILLGAYLAFLLLFPTALGASLVTVSAVAAAIAAIGFSTVFVVRQDALTASRAHDAEILRRVAKWARREQNLPVDDALAATSELWFSSWYRDFARQRTPAMLLLLYSAIGFVCATIVGISWGLEVPWALVFWVSGALAFSAFVLIRVDLRAMVNVQGSGYWHTAVRTLLYRAISPRWNLTQTAIAYDARIRRMAAELEAKPVSDSGSLNDLLSAVSGQAWWMGSVTNSPREEPDSTQ